MSNSSKGRRKARVSADREEHEEESVVSKSKKPRHRAADSEQEEEPEVPVPEVGNDEDSAVAPADDNVSSSSSAREEEEEESTPPLTQKEKTSKASAVSSSSSVRGTKKKSESVEDMMAQEEQDAAAEHAVLSASNGVHKPKDSKQQQVVDKEMEGVPSEAFQDDFQLPESKASMPASSTSGGEVDLPEVKTQGALQLAADKHDMNKKSMRDPSFFAHNPVKDLIFTVDFESKEAKQKVKITQNGTFLRDGLATLSALMVAVRCALSRFGTGADLDKKFAQKRFNHSYQGQPIGPWTNDPYSMEYQATFTTNWWQTATRFYDPKQRLKPSYDVTALAFAKYLFDFSVKCLRDCVVDPWFDRGFHHKKGAWTESLMGSLISDWKSAKSSQQKIDGNEKTRQELLKFLFRKTDPGFYVGKPEGAPGGDDKEESAARRTYEIVLDALENNPHLIKFGYHQKQFQEVKNKFPPPTKRVEEDPELMKIYNGQGPLSKGKPYCFIEPTIYTFEGKQEKIPDEVLDVPDGSILCKQSCITMEFTTKSAKLVDVHNTVKLFLARSAERRNFRELPPLQLQEIPEVDAVLYKAPKVEKKESFVRDSFSKVLALCSASSGASGAASGGAQKQIEGGMNRPALSDRPHHLEVD